MTSCFGKYRGFVASNKDPDQLGRLQLLIPSVLGTEVTNWALPCLPFGGSAGVGWFAIPEQDAQVWVEFEEGELRRPIWVGTFWQKSGDAPADAQKTPPTTRLLQTPAGHILQFDDEDSKEQIRLHHAGGAELLIDENGTITITDQAGNTITLDADQQQIAIADTNDNAITMTATAVKIERRGPRCAGKRHRRGVQLRPRPAGADPALGGRGRPADPGIHF